MRLASAVLRRSPAAAAFPAFCAVNALALFNRGTPWAGEWAWTIDWVNAAPILTGPLLASVAAWCVAADRRRAAVLDHTPRSWATSSTAAGAALAWALCAHAIMAMVAVGLTVAGPHGGPVRPWMLLIGPVVLLFHAALGGFVGFFLPRASVAVMVGPAAFVLALFGVGSLHTMPNFLRLGGVTGSLAGLTWDWRVLLAQIGVLLFGTLTLFGLSVPHSDRKTRASLASVAVGGLGVAIAWSSLNATGDERFVASAEKSDACAGSAPVVCFAPSHVRGLAGAAEIMHQMSRPLAAAGVRLPRVWAERMPYQKQRKGAGVFLGSIGPDASPELAVQSLTLPTACPQYMTGKGLGRRGLFEAQEALSAWILIRSGHASSPDVFRTRRLNRWLETPLEDQHAWVRKTYRQLRSCDLGSIAPPWRQSGD